MPLKSLAICLCHLLAFAGLGISGGCARTAKINVWQAPDANFAGIERLAVAPFVGPDNWASVAQTAIESQLAGAPVLQLLPVGPPDQVNSAVARNSRKEVLAIARQMRADAVLFGEVHVEVDRLGTAAVSIGDPSVIATVKCHLIDVQTGRTRCSCEAKRHYRGELSSFDSEMFSQTRVFTRLLEQCADEIVGKLGARRESVDVELAGATWVDSSAVRRGEQFAREGNWTAAEEQWREALEADPEDHAALYNMGLAREAAHDNWRAREYYSAAINVKNRDLYQQALARANQNDDHVRTVMRHPDRLYRLPPPY